MSRLTNTSCNSLHIYENKDKNYSDISQNNNAQISSYDTIISKIKSLPIKDVVVREGTHVEKQGSSYKALCPFHDEKTASFSICEKRNTFKCFGCGEQGNAIDFIIKKHNFSFKDAINHLQNQFQIMDTDVKKNFYVKPDYEKVNPPGKWIFEKKDFSEEELNYLGPFITKEICENYNFYSCDYYITPKGHKWKSNEKFPIFILDFGTWQKIYQPFAQDKGKRFLYINKQNQSKGFVYGLDQAKENANENESQDENIIEIFLVGGEKDALNLASLGYTPVWLNSEAEQLSPGQYKEISKIADAIYNIPDIDKAGKNYATKLNLKFLDIKTIWLPDDLKTKTDSRGNRCKDFSDYVGIFYKNSTKDVAETIKNFMQLKSAAIPLRFWQFKDNGKVTIVNTRLYAFLQAHGFYMHECKSTKGGFKFILIKNNIVQEYESHNVVRFIHEYLANTYQNEHIRDAAYRSPQTKEASIANINTIEIDTKDYGKDFQYMFFQNEAWKVTKNGIEVCKKNSLKNPVWENKVQKINCKVLEPFFKVYYSNEYLDLISDYEKETDPDNKERLKQEISDFRDIDKYQIEIRENNFSFMKFLENTSNFYWQKAEQGEELSEDEIKENRLHLINKLFALGYLLCGYKTPSKPYAVIAIDGSNVELGQHQGGTGKTIYAKSISPLVSHVIIPAQNQKLTEDPFVFSQVTKDTDYVLVNDCHASMDFHFFLNALEGDLTVNPKNNNKYAIPYEDVPKFCFTTNNAVKGIDGSIMRRLLYVVFSDYYHSQGGKFKNEYNPSHEFGKSLFQNYTEEEWIQTYNLFANCISLYLQYSHEKINPPMKQVNMRNLRQKVGDPFIEWAEDKFFEDKKSKKLNPKMLDNTISREDLYEDFKGEVSFQSLNRSDQNRYSPKGFKKCLKQFCNHYGIIMNPSDVKGYEDSSDRIRSYIDGSKKEVFYFRADESIPNNDNTAANEDFEATEDFPF